MRPAEITLGVRPFGWRFVVNRRRCARGARRSARVRRCVAIALSSRPSHPARLSPWLDAPRIAASPPALSPCRSTRYTHRQCHSCQEPFPAACPSVRACACRPDPFRQRAKGPALRPAQGIALGGRAIQRHIVSAQRANRSPRRIVGPLARQERPREKTPPPRAMPLAGRMSPRWGKEKPPTSLIAPSWRELRVTALGARGRSPLMRAPTTQSTTILRRRGQELPQN